MEVVALRKNQDRPGPVAIGAPGIDSRPPPPIPDLTPSGHRQYPGTPYVSACVRALVDIAAENLRLLLPERLECRLEGSSAALVAAPDISRRPGTHVKPYPFPQSAGLKTPPD